MIEVEEGASEQIGTKLVPEAQRHGQIWYLRISQTDRPQSSALPFSSGIHPACYDASESQQEMGRTSSPSPPLPGARGTKSNTIVKHLTDQATARPADSRSIGVARLMCDSVCTGAQNCPIMAALAHTLTQSSPKSTRNTADLMH